MMSYNRYTLGIVGGLILLGVWSRFVPHPSNFTALVAVSLYSGSVLSNKKWMLIVPVLILFFSDLLMGFTPHWSEVYVPFLLVAWTASFFKVEGVSIRILGLSLLSGMLFFLFSNFSVWIGTTMYEKTWSGLMQSYEMGLPFLRNQILGDIFYSYVLFGSHAYLRKRNTAYCSF